jgi:hypothetical protein
VRRVGVWAGVVCVVAVVVVVGGVGGGVGGGGGGGGGGAGGGSNGSIVTPEHLQRVCVHRSSTNPRVHWAQHRAAPMCKRLSVIEARAPFHTAGCAS